MGKSLSVWQKVNDFLSLTENLFLHYYNGILVNLFIMKKNL